MEWNSNLVSFCDWTCCLLIWIGFELLSVDLTEIIIEPVKDFMY